MADPQNIQSQKFLRLGFASFVVVSAILALLYFLLLAKDYAVLFENMRESDTSAVTAELAKQGISYRLRDDGHTVLVDKEEIAAARVAVAAANVLGGGDVGFELFNDSDIGLSEFSQKMNYLRALQGELTRTIMAMENIRFARVHLALPERSIFRNEQSRPSAAITVQTANGQPLAPNRILGLQQLVAAAVTDLSAEQVVILDDAGMPLSLPPSTKTTRMVITERDAFEQYNRIKAANAVRHLLGQRRFEILASADPAPYSDSQSLTDDVAASGVTTGGTTDRLKILIRTEAPLSKAEELAISARIVEQLQLTLDEGDAVGFQIGSVHGGETPTGTDPRSPPSWAKPEPSKPSIRAVAGVSPWDVVANRWLWLLLGVIAVVLWLVWRERGSLSDPERQHFADLLAEEIEIKRAQQRV